MTEEKIVAAVDRRKRLYTSILNRSCIICWYDFKDGDKIVFPGSCPMHFLHDECYRKVKQRNATCPQCRAHYNVKGKNDILVTLSDPVPTDIDPAMGELLWMTPDNVHALCGQRAPCCKRLFNEEDYVVFPEPCYAHPVHAICYIAHRFGDGTQSDLQRTIYCLHSYCKKQYHGANVVCRMVNVPDDLQRELFYRDKLLQDLCVVCFYYFIDGDVILYPGTCLHSIHEGCLGIAIAKNHGRCLTCHECFDSTRKNDVLILVAPPIHNHISTDLSQGIGVEDVHTLWGRRVACCQFPFIDDEFAVFPVPCETHPVHSMCYMMNLFGDDLNINRKRDVYCPYRDCKRQYDRDHNLVCIPVRGNLVQEDPI